MIDATRALLRRPQAVKDIGIDRIENKRDGIITELTKLLQKETLFAFNSDLKFRPKINQEEVKKRATAKFTVPQHEFR